MRPLAASEEGCVPGIACYAPLAEQMSVIGAQDVSLTAWGFGVRGMSATVFLRARGSMGSDFVWPRSADPFDTLLGYVQLLRGGWNVRIGRQEIRSGLGFSSFDGGMASWRMRGLDVEGYAGRSLARGLRSPANKALEGIEDYVPDQGVVLFGGALRARARTAAASLRYQREILSDRSGLASERASLDGSVAFARLRLTAGFDWDFGRAQAGKGHITASAPMSLGRWLLSTTLRRYVPYFSLLTIWGFFEPVAYHEVVGRVAWSGSTTVGAWLSAGWRRYGDTETATVLRPLEDTGWRAEAGGAWTINRAWRLDGSYQLEWLPGGFLSSIDGAARWTLDPRISASVNVMSFQQIEQYRLGNGRALGAGLGLDVALSDRLGLVSGVSLLRHRQEDAGVESPWNQGRAWTTLRVQLGNDPGRRKRVRR
jgi:hypothetical protein